MRGSVTASFCEARRFKLFHQVWCPLCWDWISGTVQPRWKKRSVPELYAVIASHVESVHHYFDHQIISYETLERPTPTVIERPRYGITRD